MSSAEEKFREISQKMQEENIPEQAIRNFEFYYKQLVEGKTGLIPEDTIEPVEHLPNAEKFGADYAARGAEVMDKAVMINLNGGLGTSMGLDKAKSLLMVKNGLTFLDILAKQAIKAGVPLVLMNSFATRDDSLEALKKYKELWGDLPLDFIQNKIPKIDQSDLSAVNWMANPDLEWCPPGHGDIYTALVTSGMLDVLLNAGYRYAFVSNADNLGANLDERILGYFVAHELPFMMEAADRTEADRKGGHLAVIADGSERLVLRESAQCPTADVDKFQDVSRHKYFNTNNLWINLEALKTTMSARDNVLGLPMIVNSKTVDPRDSLSTPVYQLETAMGAAISVFEGAAAIRVPRTRFAPVKTSDDLLVVQSDATILNEDFMVVPNPDRKLGTPVVRLDPDYYKIVTDLESRFPHGAPSLMYCRRLIIDGDIKFGRNIVLQGDVKLLNEKGRQVTVPDSTIIHGEWKA